jgi:hypothetical protein
MRFLYVNPDPATQTRATTLGCGWMPTVPSEFASVATAPCVILNGASMTTVLPEPTTKAAVNAAAAPILAAEQAAAAAEAQRNQNGDTIRAKAETAIAANISYLGHAAVPAGTLTTAQLSNIVRSLTDQLDAATRQLVALERLAVNKTDDVSGT